MAIAVTCGDCGKKLSAPDTSAGRKVKCPGCGSLTPIVAAAAAAKPVAKICAGCGIDVAGQKRTKDPAGRYFCQPCWDSYIGIAVAAGLGLVGLVYYFFDSHGYKINW